VTPRAAVAIALVVVAGVLFAFAATLGWFSPSDRLLIEAISGIDIVVAGLGFFAIAALLRYWT
jgi:hypothetical protein